MRRESIINDLIEKGRGIAGKEYDGTGFLRWKSHALGYLASHFGPNHAYLQYFQSFVRKPEKMSVLAGAGILVAAREQLSQYRSSTTNQPGYGISQREDLGMALG